MEVTVTGEVWHWRGPAPHHFVTVPPEQSAAISDVAAALTYGWGCLPVHGRVGDTEFTTSLIPRDGGYLIPLKVAVRRAEGVELGDIVSVTLTLDA